MSNSRPTLLTHRDSPEYCLAFYIFCTEPWEDILLNCIQPLSEQIITEKLATRYFFIRYWENGPHIRLRFFGNETQLNEQVKPLVLSAVNNYLKKHPTKREEPEWLSTAPGSDHYWFPNDSIQIIAYEPETDRYGGPAAITASEIHFQDSSNAVFSLLEPGSEWSYDRALGAAIQLHLSFAHAAGMDLTEAQEFFTFIFSGWLPRAYTNFGNEPADVLENRRELTLKAFKENFSAQQEFLVEYHQMLWEAFQSGEEFEEEWLNNWIDQVTQLSSLLKELQQKGKLQFSPDTSHLTVFTTPFEKQQLWFIYSSYVHMTNNRLGILNRDEAYLGYLLRESLKTLINS